jgi:hypothetical protein
VPPPRQRRVPPPRQRRVPPTRRQRPAPSTRPTTARLAEALAVIDQRTEDLLGAVEALQANHQTESQRIWTALGNISGLDGVAVGVAEVAELLGPLRALAPPSTALPLEPGVPQALAAIRIALGPGLQSDTNFTSVPTTWDNPVGFIGQADPSRIHPLTREEQVA